MEWNEPGVELINLSDAPSSSAGLIWITRTSVLDLQDKPGRVYEASTEMGMGRTHLQYELMPIVLVELLAHSYSSGKGLGFECTL